MKERFVLLPSGFDEAADLAPGPPLPPGGNMAAAGGVGPVAPRTPRPQPRGDVLARLGPDDAVLVRMSPQERLAMQREQPSVLVVREGRAEMAFARTEVQPIPVASMAGVSGAGRKSIIKVRDDRGRPLKRVDVVALVDLSTSPPAGVEGRTNSKGDFAFSLPGRMRAVRISAMPLATHWWACLEPARYAPEHTLTCVPIDPAALDGLRAFNPAGAAADGTGVTVAVVDGGVGPHPDVEVAGGENLAEEGATSFEDNGVGHGTHVAGIIAAGKSAKSPGGLAPGVKLLSYRVYKKGSSGTGSFAVAAAIRKAVEAGADLINLSLVLNDEDRLITREIQRALARGTVCVAAAGNVGGPVSVPARLGGVLGVSAVGVRNSWPNGALDSDLLRSPRARHNRKLAMASFSNFGPEIDFTAPGVGIVSTLHRGRLGVMKGTSMAAPAVTALIARALSADAALLNAARDRDRSDRILTKARSIAKQAGFGDKYEGYGLLS